MEYQNKLFIKHNIFFGIFKNPTEIYVFHKYIFI